MRATVPRLESITSIRPGPWWLKPLWSLRQQVEVSRMFSEAIDSRQGRLSGLFQPLGVLHRHRGRDHRERLIGGEQAMAPGQQVAFQPALAVVLAEHLHHPAVGRHVVVDVEGRADEAAVLDLEDVAQAVRVGLVRAEQAEVGLARRSARRCRASAGPAGGSIRRARWPAAAPRAHTRGSRACAGFASSLPPLACGLAPMRRRPRGASVGQLRDQLPVLVEQFRPAGSCASRLPAAASCSGSLAHVVQRHLVRAERALDRHAVDLLRSGPALGRAQHDRRPARAARARRCARASCLDGADARVAGVERRGELLVHARRIVALHEIDLVAVALDQRAHIVVGGRGRAPSGWRSCSR